MTARYWCAKCQMFVEPVRGEFVHPHQGLRPTYLCPTCRQLVYQKVEQ